jgi:hypothetical protein
MAFMKVKLIFVPSVCQVMEIGLTSVPSEKKQNIKIENKLSLFLCGR